MTTEQALREALDRAIILLSESRAALALPPSETREEWRVRYDLGGPQLMDACDLADAQNLAECLDGEVTIESRTVSASPWSEVPAGTQPSPQAECADLIGQVFDRMIDAAPVEAPKLQVIERIDSEAFPDDAVAFFAGGCFCATSRPRRVTTLCAFHGHEDEPCQKCGKSFHSPDHQAPIFDPRTPR